jgi:hypothetical protein
MPKIPKPDLSKPCLLCRFEISLLIPENKPNSFLRNFDEMQKELIEAFGEITLFFYKSDQEIEKDNRMVIVLFVRNDDYQEVDKFFKKKISLWKQQFGQEEFLVLMSEIRNLA